jgi:hypothetical protein
VISTALRGKCVSYISDNIGFSVSMLLEFHPISKMAEFRAVKSFTDQSANGSIISSFYDKILLQFSNITSKVLKQCGRCETFFGEEEQHFYQEKRLFIQTALHTNTKCTMHNLLSNSYLFSHKKHQFSVNIDNQSFEFITNVKFDLDFESILSLNWRYRLKSRFCEHPYHFKGELVCPKVSLNETEFRLLQTKSRYRGTVQEREILNIQSNITSNNDGKEAPARNVENKLSKVYDMCWNEYYMFINTGNSINMLVWVRVINAAFHALLMLLIAIQ